MTDTPVQKGFWRAIRTGLTAAIRWCAHAICLIPVAILKFLIGICQGAVNALTHLHDELAKV